MSTQMDEGRPTGLATVLACVLPVRPVVRRLTLSLEDASALSVRAWLGEDDDGTQLEMLGPPGRLWEPWMVTLGGLDAGGSLAGMIAERFEVSGADASAVERLVRRTGMVGSIAVEAGGVEGLHELELRVQDRLAHSTGVAA